ncbi:MAG: hypothetical protein ACI4S2_15790 [Lachnospiraceae bacterium]
MNYNKDVVDNFINSESQISKSKSIYIFGAGYLGKVVGAFLNINKIKWIGFIDNNCSLWGKDKENHPIFSPDKVQDYKTAHILIAVNKNLYLDQVEQIVAQLLRAGVAENSIERISFDFELVNAMDYLLCDGDQSLQRNKSLKNIYKGQRAFVIGNGPSLTLEDLDKMSGEITLSCNNSMQLWNKTVWRPTCFWGADHLFIDKNVNTEEKLQYILENCKYMFTNFRSGLYEKYRYKYDNLFYLYLYGTNELMFSEDISAKTYSVGSSIFVLLQLAIYMGIEEIFLVGCDYSFRQEVRKDGSVAINHEVQTHMKLMDQEKNGRYCVDLIMEEYLCAKTYADMHNIKIYNATRGGKLEVFERVDFDSLF